jgi:hypothetical protein
MKAKINTFVSKDQDKFDTEIKSKRDAPTNLNALNATLFSNTSIDLSQTHEKSTLGPNSPLR